MTKFLVNQPPKGTVKILDVQSQDYLDIGPQTPVLVLLEGDAKSTLQGDKPEHVLTFYTHHQFASLTASGWAAQHPERLAYVRDDHIDLWWPSRLVPRP